MILLSIVLFPLEVIANSATQTDWSGGPGEWGPVSLFGTRFYIETSIFFDGSITLGISEHIVDGYFDGACAIYAEDVNGDGDMDVLGAATWDDEISWWENDDGTGTTWTEHIIDGYFDGAQSVFAEDVDGDGDMDVLGAASLADDVTWWENDDGTGTTWTEHLVDGDFEGAYSVYAEDVDDDGDMDVLGAAVADDDITWWENDDGTGTTWTEHLVDGDFEGACSVFAEDVDGDGDMDILASAFHDDEITWWENNDGSGIIWTEHLVDGDFDEAISVYAKDMDGDGDMDVLGAALDGNEITWWENDDGTGTTWTKHLVDGDFEGAYSVCAEDVDDDGDIDILGAAFYDNAITWWENDDGTGTTWTEHLVDGGFEGAFSVYAEDVDGDGDMDVLGAALHNRDITWWDLIGYANMGTLESSVLDIGGDPTWDLISWVSAEPSGTSVAFQVRASDNSSNMGTWSDTLYSACSLIGILENNDSFLQYKAILTTVDSTITPTLDEVTFSWDILGIESGEEPEQFRLLPMCPNPANSTSMLRFTVPEPMSVSLSIFDLTGRLIYEQIPENYSTGNHSITLTDLTPGIYFCRIVFGDQEDMQRFVVVE
jgi:hypothetical protein